MKLVSGVGGVVVLNNSGSLKKRKEIFKCQSHI